MSGLEGGAAVFSLVVGVIEIIHRAIEIYEAVNDKSGIPKTLKKVSEKLPSVEEILKSAEAQHKAGALKDIDKDTWASAEREVEKCKQACQELHDLLQSAYPKADSGRSERLWKGAKTVLSGKGKTAEALLKEISDYLTFLAQRKIVNNAALLEDIKSLVEELCPETTTTHMHNVNGDNIGTLHGDKNVNSGSGFQFTGSGGTYNFGGAQSEDNQWALLSLRHRHHKPFSEENSIILRKWISRSYGHSQSLTVPDSSRVRFEKIYKRISNDDPIATYQRLSGRKADNTTRWLVEHEDFQSWLSEDPAKHRLWLSGKVGSGKSTLVTTVIDECHANLKSGESSAVLMFFFNSHDDTALSFFESLTKQLIATLIGIDVPSSRDILSALETAYGNDISRPHIAQVFEDLVVPLCQILQQITLVIDGIDECRAAEVKQLWHWLERLLKLVQPRILITSEDQANISPRFKGFHRIRIDHLHNQFDIDTYINERIASKSSAGQVLYDESLRDEVKVTLHQKANGMFLWIHLVLNIILEDCETPAQVRKAVDEIPPDLQAVYSLCLENRRGTARPIKANLFLWTCAAPNPLSIGALGELIAMDLETGHVDTDEIPFADVLLKSGAGLITLDTSAIPNAQSDEHLVIPVHSTVRDFIFSERFRSLAAKASHQESWPLCVETGQWSENTFRTALGSLCLSHIKQRTSRELGSRPPPTRLVVPQPKVLQSVAWVQKILIGVRSKSAEMTAVLPVPGRNKTRVSTTNFLRYSIENWLVCNTNLASATANFPWLAKENQKSDLHTAAEFFEEISIERNDFYGIHPWKAAARTSNSHLSQMFAYAVANNHVPLMQVVRKHRRRLPKEVFDSPLAQHGQMLAIHVAAKKGFASIIEELVNICNVNAMCPSRRQHVLHFIAENGTEDCLQPILSMNLDWNARNRDGRTALFVAMVAGHDDIVKALLEAEGFEIDEEATFCQVLLHWAVYHGHDKVKQLLLDTGKAAIDEEKEWYYDLLSWAARNGYDKIVQLLLDISKAASDEQNKWYDAILSWAAHNSYDEIVGPLLETGAVNSTDKDGLTPLYRASLRGLDKVVQLLLDTGEVDVNAATKDGRTPFYWAARFGHDKVVQLLIETGKVDVNAADEDGEIPLHQAASYGRDKVVQLLLETGKVDVNAAENDGETPLHQAAYTGYDKVVRLLLETGKVDVNAVDKDGKTPLHQAAYQGHDRVVRLLLETGKVDVNAADKNAETSFYLAIYWGHDKVVRLLLETGNVNVNAANNNGETPLHCAASRGHEHVVQLLLGKGKAEVDAADHAGRTALISAASSSHDKVVQLLLTRSNADIKAADHKGQTALDYARSQGHERIVQLLERLSSDDFFDRTMAMIECTSAYGSTEE
ncbi:hypothetical protein CKM354_001296300 [Cercospora kikuchii]|uniref:NACHT domain-containing protein n=1 Tax=Cercospora kikuchii TaxID=84275 RepID=A0A9P3L3A2_9PEZI|nr:uncharacterized protein CKM354_001296300 [Cercospora kikuchii]GIZ49947.1 hypothetical protein CKM354_001296300 [Cercospora kikuchii]